MRIRIGPTDRFTVLSFAFASRPLDQIRPLIIQRIVAMVV